MDLVLKNKYKIQILSESVTLKEAIDGIAYTLNISLIETGELKNIGIAKGDSIELYDYLFGSNNYEQIFRRYVCLLWLFSRRFQFHDGYYLKNLDDKKGFHPLTELYLAS